MHFPRQMIPMVADPVQRTHSRPAKGDGSDVGPWLSDPCLVMGCGSKIGT